MREPLSSEFVFSFVEECFRAGLTKEAAAELLQHQTLMHAADHNPAFVEGYLSVCPALPVLHAEDFVTKEAMANRGIGRVGRSLVDLVRGTGEAAIDTAKGVGRAGLRFIGPPRPRVAGGPPVKSFVGRHPYAGFGIGVAGAGAASYGLHKLVGGDSGPTQAPFLPKGGYNADDAAKSYETLLNSKSEGIADNSRAFNQSNARRQVLQTAIDRGDANSEAAMSELRELDRERARASTTRDQFLGNLDRTGVQTEGKLKSLQQRRTSLESSRGKWSGLPRKLWYNLNGNGLSADQEYDQALNKTQADIAHETEQSKLIKDQKRRTATGYIGTQPRREPQQMQKDFFPTY